MERRINNFSFKVSFRNWKRSFNSTTSGGSARMIPKFGDSETIPNKLQIFGWLQICLKLKKNK